jgi:hypothetical protein
MVQPDLRKVRTFEPLNVATIAWLVLLGGLYVMAGWVLGRASIAPAAAVWVMLSAIGLVWLRIYFWASDPKFSLTGFAMPLAGLLAGLVGGMNSLTLLAIIPATAAFSGSISLVNTVSTIELDHSRSRWLKALPFGWVVAVGLSIIATIVGGVAFWIGLLIVAVPTGVALYFAYTVLPEVVGEQVNQMLAQFSGSPVIKDFLDRQNSTDQTLDVEAQVISLPTIDGIIPPKHKSVLKSQDWASRLAVIGPLVVPMAAFLAGSGLITYLYWKINQWMAAIFGWLLDLSLPGTLQIDWGWDWFKVWLVAWSIAVIVAVARVAQRAILWPSLLYTLSIVGSALLMPTALVWAMLSSQTALLTVAGATLLGLALGSSVMGMQRTCPTKTSGFVLSIVTLLGLGVGRLMGG